MDFPKHFVMQTLPMLLMACLLVRCQTPRAPDIGDEEEKGKENDTRTMVTKTELIECPLECSCTAEGAVDCAGVDLTEFPPELSNKIRQLSLQNNKIRKVTVEHISHLNQLETLNLQNNWLTTDGLEDEGFAMLDQLAYLYLANNKLVSAPEVLPPSLVSADFAANQLTRIYPYTFGHKPKLRSVYLHNNKLTDAGLPDHMFIGSVNLEILTMSSNFLHVVPSTLPSSLYRLHLKNNKLEKIPAGVFDNMPNLRELYLQNNFLSNGGLDNDTFSQLSRLECLDLSNNNLSVVPKGLPYNLVMLHLEKNSIHTIPGDALTSVRNLEYLLLHNNKLRSRFIHPAAFQEIVEIRKRSPRTIDRDEGAFMLSPTWSSILEGVNRQQRAGLPCQILEGLKKLHTLHMYNNLLERIPRGLPRRAKILMLLHNSISEIGRNDLTLLFTLVELNLSYNKLTSPKINHEAFRKLRMLESLDLSGNNLQSMPLGLPRSLQVLEIKNNKLHSIPDGALTGMEKLQKLILSGNHLKLNSVYQGAWMELSALKTLDLSSNQLSHIPSDLPESLEYLYLQSNHISSVPASAFEGTPNIKGIFLRFNRLPLSLVDEVSFAHLSNLQVMDFETGNKHPFKREEMEGDKTTE